MTALTPTADTRQNLSYATRYNGRHAVTVATWTKGTDLGFRMMVDDRELVAGTIPAGER